MKKIKYEDAVMEIVRFDFEDVLDASDLDNVKEYAGENPDDAVGIGSGDVDLGSGGW